MYTLRMTRLSNDVEYVDCKTILSAKRTASKLFKNNIAYFSINDIRDVNNKVVAEFNYWTNNKQGRWINYVDNKTN